MNDPTPATSARFAGLLLWVVILGGCGLTWMMLQPPGPVRTDAPLADFSAERALAHVRAVAQQPHPMGSPANQAAGTYIQGQLNALGLTAEVQPLPGRTPPGTNVMARIPGHRMGSGPSPAKAVALVCHYDSASRAPGASDDGVAVAALLEAARALKSGPKLHNDIILLFTDGEERGMLGAKAFVAECSWNREIGLILNFEARGISGPVYMFETAPGNSRVIREFARGAPHPVANSLMYEVYRRMPNDTDFTIFRQAGVPGLNFAFIGEPWHYHEPSDDLAHLSPRCLQQHGDYALHLARHFGNIDLTQLQGRDAVYFDVLGRWLARYPEALALPLALTAATLLVAVTVRERRRREISIGKLTLGCLTAGVTVALVGVAFYFARDAAKGLEKSAPAWFRRFWGWPYWWMAAGFTVAMASTIHAVLRRWLAPANLALGAWFWWATAAAATTIWLPGASYLFLWPLLFGLLGRLLAPLEERASWRGLAWLFGMALPVIVLISPVVWQFYVALGPHAMFVPMLALALALGALSLQVEAAYRDWKWGLPLAGLLVMVLSLIR